MTGKPLPARAPEDTPANPVGAVSLAIATAGAVVSHLLARPLANPEWLNVVRAGFEAAMVGGFADWFAVTALFRHPLGLPIPHTAIIKVRRQKIIDGIVRTVVDDWLSPEVLGARVSRAKPADAMQAWLQDPAKVAVLDAPLRGIMRGLSEALLQKEIVEGLDRVIRDQLSNYPIDASSGKWLSRMVESDNAIAAFEAVARSFAGVARRPTTARKMHEWLEHSARHMEDEGKRLLPLVLKSSVVRHKIVEAACNYAGNELEHASHEQDHPLRRHAFEALRKFATRLSEDEPESMARLESLRRSLLENLSSEPLSAEPLRQLRKQLLEELDREDSALVAQTIARIRDLCLRIFEDEANREAFTSWVRAQAIELVARNHHQIGLTLRESLESIDADTLVAQIEDRIGADLQFIRLNGALVGGLIGVILALVHLVIG